MTTASDDPRQRQKAVLDALIKACRQCDRPDRLNVPGVTESAPGYGSVYSPAAIVGEALCRAYMEKQEPFYGGSGRVLDRCYKRAGFDPTDLFNPFLIIPVLLFGGVLRSMLGRLLGSAAAGGLVTLIAWYFFGSLLAAAVAGMISSVIVMFSDAITAPAPGGRGRGGGWVGGSGGSWSGGSSSSSSSDSGSFSGGGGSFGGGGASGSW